MIELWPIYNSDNDLFDRVVWDRWRLRRQQLYLNPDTARVTWRDVPMFKKKFRDLTLLEEMVIVTSLLIAFWVAVIWSLVHYYQWHPIDQLARWAGL